MTTVGEAAKVSVSKPTAQNAVLPHGNRQAYYHHRVQEVIDQQGVSATRAFEIVAEESGGKVVAGTVQTAYYRQKRKGDGASPRKPAHRKWVEPEPVDAWTPPKALQDILDGLAKAQQEQARYIEALKTWARSQEETVDAQRRAAYQDTMSKIREAAGLVA